MAMTDGVQLATDIYRLQEGLPAPVLLVRTVLRAPLGGRSASQT